ncbi:MULTISPECIES: hypothetical protein [unclassified Nocardia]|uniref:hypothetical protein n=1 Tax=unclassified Nocardia TaxID=2637762 RepID=UPI001CE48594|nr:MULTISPECIES: hypothetical protein [unclassified Nocardia]
MSNDANRTNRTTTPRDPEGCYFAVRAIPTPPGEWSYILDDFGVVYGSGWWPFHAIRENLVTGVATLGPTQIRVAPDTAYYSWQNQYVLLVPDLRDSALVTCRIQLYVRPIAVLVDRTVTLDLRAEQYQLDPRGCPPALFDQLDTKAQRLLRFVLAHRAARCCGESAPTTAYDRWLQSNERSQ